MALVERVEWKLGEVARTTETFLRDTVTISEREGIELFPGLVILLPHMRDTIRHQMHREHQMSSGGLVVGFSSLPPTTNNEHPLYIWRPRLNLGEEFESGSTLGDMLRVREITMELVAVGAEQGLAASLDGSTIVLGYPTETFAKTKEYVELPLLGEL